MAVEILQAAGFAAARVIDCVDVGDHPAIRARDRFVRITHPVVGTVEYPLWAIAGADPEPLFDRPAPTLGQHKDAVLGELAATDQEIAELVQAGVVASDPRF